MFANISIVIVNSSHEAIDSLSSVLKSKILSRQRPHIACLSRHELRLERSFFEEFINEKLLECRLDLEKAKQIREFNQLEAWRVKEQENRINKKRSTSSRISSRKEPEKNQFSISTRERDRLQRIIIDFPIEHGIELYLILFDINDSDTIKSIASFELVPLLGIVSFYPRNFSSSARFCREQQQFDLSEFDDIAFIDVDVPVESNYMLDIRSQLIYDQFCHLLYDFEELKGKYRIFNQHLVIHDVSIDFAENENDLRQLKGRLNKIPQCMLTVERIYGVILEQIEQQEVTMADNNMELSEFMDFEAFGKRFYDMNDEWRRKEINPIFYASEIRELKQHFSYMWKDIENVTLERRQILNYFMNKIKGYAENYSEDTFEFYFYILKFLNWNNKYDNPSNSKEYLANRSIGHKKTEKSERLRCHSSDIHVEYRNLSNIPDEIEQLASDTVNNIEENFYVHLFTTSGMLQKLRKVYGENFYRQYFKLFDVLLLRFPPRIHPPKYSLKRHKIVLPTPLCFRDFNHYIMSMDSLKEVELKNDAFHGDVGDKMMTSVYKPENFILASSIKSQQTNKFDDDDVSNEEKSGKMKSTDSKDESTLDECDNEIHVYNACNKRVEYHVTESEFNSYRLSTSASVLSSLHNSQLHMNFSCTLHDTKHLSCSFDLRGSGLNCSTVTLADDNSGMICSIDRDNMKLSYPHGMLIEISDTIGINFIELNERCSSDDDDDYNPETKRTYFSDGFVMIHMLSGDVKILSSNGTTYEIATKQQQQQVRRESIQNQELTKQHQFAIATVEMFKKFISFRSFVMTLANGDRFLVEGESIVEELSSVHAREWFDSRTGNLYTQREDGMRLLRTDAYMKCQYPSVDGTVITTIYNNMEILLVNDNEASSSSKQLPILDALWKSEAENESKFVIDDVLNCVSSDYFLNINQTCQFEHEKCGIFRFDVSGLELKLPNGAVICKWRM